MTQERDSVPHDAGRHTVAGKSSVHSASQVELRSDLAQRVRDVATTEIRSSGAGGKQHMLLIGGVVALALLLVGGMYAFVRMSNRTAADDERQRAGEAYGDLPLALEREQRATDESGLSGRTCEDAQRRPIGAMLSSDPITRPVSGFADADLVFELPVLVNDVTRLLAVYQCGRPAEIGSVRSARHDYLFLAEGIDAVVAHWGGSYHALNRISAGEFQTINALVNPHKAYFRKTTLPAPYNGFTTYENLWNALQKLGYRTTAAFEGYSFKDDPLLGDRPLGGTLSIGWPGAFRVHYEYEQATNRYQRFWGGTRHVDGGSGIPVMPSVVVVMRAANQDAEGPGGYNEVAIEGHGVFELYQDGTMINGTWEKNELNKKDPLRFLDEAGKPIIFTRGQVWVMAVEPEISVTWEPKRGSVPISTQQPGSTPAF